MKYLKSYKIFEVDKVFIDKTNYIFESKLSDLYNRFNLENLMLISFQ